MLKRLIALFTPGLLIAATGVGAGDLITSGFAGMETGTTLLWAIVFGALLKFSLTEGLARWQMATGTTLLEGWAHRLGPWIRWIFLVYLLCWSFFVGGALVNACGVAAHGIFPLHENAQTSKIVWGVTHSLAGLLLIRLGGYRVFEKVMSVCVVVMFCAVILTAVLLGPDLAAVGRGLWPGVPAEKDILCQ